MGTQEGEEREEERKIFEIIMTKSFPNLMWTLIYTSKKLKNTKKDKYKDICIQIHHNILKAKDKENILKVTGEK